MAGSFVVAALGTNRPLWRLVHRFNCRPAADLHPEHLAGHLDTALFERLRRIRRAERSLSAWVVRRFELDPRGHWDFAEPRWRLALLSGGQLERVVRLVGVAAMHRRIAQTVLGPQIRVIRESLGDEDHQFAIKRAAFLTRQLPAELEPASLATNPAAQAAEIGWLAVRGCLTGAPPAIMERVALKLSPQIDVRRAASLPPSSIAATFRLAQRIVAFEVAPELAPCFN
jgi:hypothetical protein